MFCSDETTVPLPSPMVTSGLALSGALFTQSVNHAEEETETDTSRSSEARREIDHEMGDATPFSNLSASRTIEKFTQNPRDDESTSSRRATSFTASPLSLPPPLTNEFHTILQKPTTPICLLFSTGKVRGIKIA